MRRNLPLHTRMMIQELERRQAKNPLYSLRAFAAFLGLHPSALSRVLANKTDLSLKACARVLRKLNLDKDTQKLFIASVAENKMNQSYVILTRAIGFSETVENFDPREQIIVSPERHENLQANSVLSFSEDLICVTDLKGRFLFASESLARALQAVPCDLIGLTWYETDLAESNQQILLDQENFYAKNRSDQDSAFIELGLIDRRVHERRMTPIFDSAGAAQGDPQRVPRGISLALHF